MLLIPFRPIPFLELKFSDVVAGIAKELISAMANISWSESLVYMLNIPVDVRLQNKGRCRWYSEERRLKKARVPRIIFYGQIATSTIKWSIKGMGGNEQM